MVPRSRFGGSIRPTLLVAACLSLPPSPAEAQRLGRRPAGMSPDSVGFTTSELYVLDRGTVSVFSLPDLVRTRASGGSGRGRGRLSPNHTFDQAIRVSGQGVLAEDNDKTILFSSGNQVLGEERKPENTAWFVPVGDGYVARSMVVAGTPPIQVMRLVIYDSDLREVKELYRQPWFQQRQGSRFSTERLGDLLHFTVAQDRIAVEESPKGFVIEVFDAAGAPLRTITHIGGGVPVTAADKARELALGPTDAETEARVSGTAFFKVVGDRFYYPRHDVSSDRWDVHVAAVPDGPDIGREQAARADTAGVHQAGPRQWRTAGGGTVDAETMDAHLRRLAAEPGITALSVAVIDDGQTMFARTMGVVDRTTQRPVDERTVFRAASLSKPVFAYLVMRLVDEGLLDLDAPVVRYLPKLLSAYPAYASLRDDARYERLTARLLLSHQSGFPNWRRIRPDGPISFDATPGERFGYSGEGYRLLQFVVETITGRDLASLARDTVFTPLGMNDTSFRWEPRFDGRFAVDLDSGLGPLVLETRRTGNAAGSLITHAPDYARFLAAVVNGTGLSPRSRAVMLNPEVALTSRSLFSPPATDAGASRIHRLAWTPGWGTFTDAYGRSIFHVGREEGCENYAEARLDRGPGIVILSVSMGPDSFSGPLVDAAIGSAYSPLAWLGYGRPVASGLAARVPRWGQAGLALIVLVLVVWRVAAAGGIRCGRRSW